MNHRGAEHTEPNHTKKNDYHRGAEGTEPHHTPKKRFYHEGHEDHEAQPQHHPGRKYFIKIK